MKTYKDSTFMSMTKKELIEYIRMIEKNHANMEWNLDTQYKTYVRLYRGVKNKEQINERIKDARKLIENETNPIQELCYLERINTLNWVMSKKEEAK